MAPKKPNIEIHGHRGSRGTHPENTLPGFREAVVSGAEYFELDIQMSADDVPIVFHDPCLTSRLCRDPDGRIVDGLHPLRALQAADIVKYTIGRTPIPTLEDTLAWLAKASPTAGVNIEMKVEATHPELIPDVKLFTKNTLDLVEKYGLLARTQFQSFDFRPLREARRRFPSLRISCLFEEEMDFAAEALAVDANVVGPFYKLLTPARIADCHARGLKVIPWTVNGEEEWKELIAMGVDGLITDYPRKLAKALGRA
jgi:glycerophosphoryl diester phosphodiesterase